MAQTVKFIELLNSTPNLLPSPLSPALFLLVSLRLSTFTYLYMIDSNATANAYNGYEWFSEIDSHVTACVCVCGFGDMCLNSVNSVVFDSHKLATNHCNAHEIMNCAHVTFTCLCSVLSVYAWINWITLISFTFSPLSPISARR